MKIKVCGLTEPGNVREIVAAGVDMVGFNFWKSSPRAVDDDILPDLCDAAGAARRVGVFVNDSLERLATLAPMLDYIQLHGDESADYCLQVAELTGLPVIKAIGIANGMPELSEFRACAGLLFDTSSAKYGGTGRVFQWDLLKPMASDQFGWLAGGIGPKNAVAAARSAKKYRIEALDLNSQVEIRPGFKSAELVREVVKAVKVEF